MKFKIGQSITYTRKINASHVLWYGDGANHPDYIKKTARIIKIDFSDKNYYLQIKFDDGIWFYLSRSDANLIENNITKYFL